MADLWKYYTQEHHKEFVLSLGLLEGITLPAEKQLACLYAVSNHTERHYTPVLIPKRDGTERKLLAPDPLLKKIQRNLLHHVLEELPVSPYATAYRKGESILQNASPHKGKAQILSMDIRDFFGSISYLMVYRVFPRVLYPPSVAALLAHLCCYQDYLPQGAPTSAALSNLVMKPFDEFMGRWCEARGILFTRYCDDMTFSGAFEAGFVIRKVTSFLLSMGFEVNERKTRVMRRGQRQTVTGLVVNEKAQVPRAYRDKLRQELYYLRKYGVESHRERMGEGELSAEQYLRSVLGRVNFVLQVEPEQTYFAKARAWLQAEVATR